MNLPKDYISNSAISRYLDCGEYYRRSDVEKQNPFNITDRESLIVGKACHSYFSAREKTESNRLFLWYYTISEELDKMIGEKTKKVYKAEWKINPCEHLKQFAQEHDFETCKQILESVDIDMTESRLMYDAICDYYVAHEKEIIGKMTISNTEKKLEYVFTRYSNDVAVVAYLDAIGIEDEKHIIVEYKTTKKSWSPSQAVTRQGMIYSWLYYQIYQRIPELRYFVFVHLKKGVKMQKFIVQHTPESLEGMEREIYNVCRGIREKIFVKNTATWKCSPKYCEYYDDCQKNRPIVTGDSDESKTDID